MVELQPSKLATRVRFPPPASTAALPYTALYNTGVYSGPNPFRFGDIALDDAFTDREESVRELVADMGNGQNVVLYAPRRYGKTSLVWRAANEAIARGVSVAYCETRIVRLRARIAAAVIVEHNRANRVWKGLILTGAEITLRRDLPELARLARAGGFEHVRIQTHGMRLAL